MLLELAQHIGLDPKKVSSVSGGEFHSPCPACGGRDRFIIWSEENRFWCRRCNCQGDSIDFCRQFLGMSFVEAKELVVPGLNYQDDVSKKQPFLKPIRSPSGTWISKAEEFIESSHRRLMIDLEALSLLKTKYGLLPETIRNHRVGWNPLHRKDRKSLWGLPEDEKNQFLGIPRGIVIPVFSREGIVLKIKTRRANWTEGDRFGKYKEIEGSSNRSAIYGFLTNETVIIVESELDAICLCQQIGEFCTCLATGGASKRPDSETLAWLRSRRLILYAQDSDPAGCDNFFWWQSTLSNVRAWPAEVGKSPADSFVHHGIDLKSWWLVGIDYC